MISYTRDEMELWLRQPNEGPVNKTDLVACCKAMRSGDNGVQNGKLPHGGRQDKATLIRGMIAWLYDPTKTAGVPLERTPAEPPPWQRSRLIKCTNARLRKMHAAGKRLTH